MRIKNELPLTNSYCINYC